MIGYTKLEITLNKLSWQYESICNEIVVKVKFSAQGFGDNNIFHTKLVYSKHVTPHE